MILLCKWWFPTLVRKMLCHDSQTAWAHRFPSGWVRNSYTALVVCVMVGQQRAYTVLFCSNHDAAPRICHRAVSQPGFHPNRSHNMKFSRSFLTVSYVNYTVTFWNTLGLCWLPKTPQSSRVVQKLQAVRGPSGFCNGFTHNGQTTF